MVRAFETLPRYIALLRSQYWNREQFRAYTENRLERILKAASRISFYANRFDGVAQLQDFDRLPLLKRADILELNLSVRSLYGVNHRFLVGASSGSSGMHAQFIFDRARVRGRYAARIRFLRAHGWRPISRTVWLRTGPFPGEEDADFVHHRILKGFLALSTDLADQVEKLLEIDPLFLYVFPSNLDGILRILEAKKRSLRSLRRIFTVCETLEDELRDRTRRVLGVEIADQYGATEGSIAWQCPQGRYHVNAEHVLIELLDEAGKRVDAGKSGRVVITTLENYLMPLVRYEIGDYAIAADGDCPCGRTLPMLERVIGRKFSLFRRPDGRLFSAALLTELVRGCPGIGQFQIIQRATNHCIVRYVAGQPIASETESHIAREFSRVFNTSVQVTLERVGEIARTNGGKYLIAISELSGT